MTDETGVRILLISGSVRSGSTNTAVLRTVAAIAPDDVTAELYEGIELLPHFNPDADAPGKRVPAPVEEMRSAVRADDALLICTPEYAGGLPAVLKNLLEWTVGDACTYGKPVAWINVSGPAAPTGGADAHQSLEKVLRYTGADIVEPACRRIALTRQDIGAAALIENESARALLRRTLVALVDHVRERACEPGTD
jgi:NAD(P)H-dependent FMN reductase